MTSRGRTRVKFDLDALLDAGDLDVQVSEDVEEENRDARFHAPPTKRRSRNRRAKRTRPPRKNIRLASPDLAREILAMPAFWEIAAALDVPVGRSGPKREYNAAGVFLWLCIYDEFDSWRHLEAFFQAADNLFWNDLCSWCETIWPYDPSRRLFERPQSRSQFDRHRAKLRKCPGRLTRAIQIARDTACQQALDMGYFANQRSLSQPTPSDCVVGDGTFIRARFDGIEGELARDDTTGEIWQPRFDGGATVGRTDDGGTGPGYRIVNAFVDEPQREQEGILLGFERALSGGESPAFGRLLDGIKARIEEAQNWVYDMAPGSEFVQQSIRKGWSPTTKLPRDNGKAANHLVLIDEFTAGGRRHQMRLFGIDGVLTVRCLSKGRSTYVKLQPIRAKRRGSALYGEYAYPDDARIPASVVGRHVWLRLDGDTPDGRPIARYLRWHNEHTDTGERLLAHRNTVESYHNTLEKTLHGRRARSVGESNVTLDLLGFGFARNTRSALAFRRRTGSLPGAPPALSPAA